MTTSFKTMSLPPHLIQQVTDGKVVLVLGAGASDGASHPGGDRPPIGQGLAKLISTKFLGGRYVDSPLTVVSELAINETDLRTVQEYVAEIFDPFTPGEFHKLLPEFRWHGIATVNYDLIVERSYQGSKVTRLRPLLSNSDRVEDHLRSPNDLLLLKLHGCITRVNDSALPLILTPDQYITHRKNRSRLFEIFGGWARDRTLVFVGTTLADFDLRAILLEVSEQEAIRPRYYFVTPSAPPELSRLWESKKIHMLEGTFADFLFTLNQEVRGIARSVRVRASELPVFERFNDRSPTLTDSTRLILEHDVVYVHGALKAPMVDPKQFYKGFGQSLSAIQQNLDCPRELADQVLLETVLHEDPTRRADIVPIRASAGSGKSVFLHRLAWNAAIDLKAFCLISEQGAGLTPESLVELSDLTSERIYLFVDDVGSHVSNVEKLLEAARQRRIPLTVVAAERSNEWNVNCESLLPYVSKPYELQYLNDWEIGKLLDLLAKHGALGTLAGLPREEQEDALRRGAGGQLLVALHEATLGKPFEEIIKDEFDALIPERAQNIYLTICTLNRTGTPVRAGLISRVHGVSFDRFKDEFFAPLEHVVFTKLGRRGHDHEYQARHPHIAELVFRQVLSDPEKRFDQFIQILAALNVSYESDRGSFRHMVNARTLRDLLPDHKMIEQIYELAERRVPDDGHVYLQHGLYEMRRLSGNLGRAEEFLKRAHDLMPRNPVVTHSFAELEISVAEAEANPLVRESHLKTARNILAPQLNGNAKSAHPFHTAFKIEHIRLRDLLGQDGDPVLLAKTVRDAEKVLAEGLQQFPNDSHLLDAESELAETLQQSKRAIAALEKAASTNLRNVHAVGRLAQIYRGTGAAPKAKDLLKRAIDAVPFERRFHYLMAQILLDEGANGPEVERHLRKSFNEGDRNIEAQFWYARQLYVSGKLDDARARYERFGELRIAPHIRYGARAVWTEAGQPRIFGGRLARLEQYFGLIQRDATGDIVMVRRDDDSNSLAGLSEGDRVKFTIAFNFKGPVAQNVRIE